MLLQPRIIIKVAFDGIQSDDGFSTHFRLFLLLFLIFPSLMPRYAFYILLSIRLNRINALTNLPHTIWILNKIQFSAIDVLACHVCMCVRQLKIAHVFFEKPLQFTKISLHMHIRLPK